MIPRGWMTRGELGALRVQKGLDVLRKTDIALLIVDGTAGMSPEDERLEEELKKRRLPYLVVFNKWDLVQEKSAGGREFRRGAGG